MNKCYRYTPSTVRWMRNCGRRIPWIVALAVYSSCCAPLLLHGSLSEDVIRKLYIYSFGVANMLLVTRVFAHFQGAKVILAVHSIEDCILRIRSDAGHQLKSIRLEDVKGCTIGQTKSDHRTILKLDLGSRRVVKIQELVDMNEFFDELKNCISVPILRSKVSLSPWSRLDKHAFFFFVFALLLNMFVGACLVIWD